MVCLNGSMSPETVQNVAPTREILSSKHFRETHDETKERIRALEESVCELSAEILVVSNKLDLVIERQRKAVEGILRALASQPSFTYSVDDVLAWLQQHFKEQ